MRTRGKVKWFDGKKGFGFIEIEDSPDIFVHYSSILGSGYRVLVEDEEVEFEIEETEKGLTAREVQRLNQPPE